MNIPTWKERLFAEQPDLVGKYPENSGFYDEVGCWIKDEEIGDLREALEKYTEALTSLRFSLQDALGFAELVEAVAKPDVEMYKHELMGDSLRAQQRLNVAIEEIDGLGD